MNMRQSFEAAARDLLGPQGFTTDPDLIAPWLVDWRGRYHGAAIGMASPATTGEVAAFVRLCGERGVPIVPQGGNSGMSGGATPDPGGGSVILSLRRMQKIRALDPDAGHAICEAGVVLQSLHAIAAEHRLRFPLTLGGKGSATIGGLVSTNAGGSQVLRHGTMRAQVLGVEAVLADGSVFDGLTPLKKDNRGFDLKQLFIGSEGALGIVTAATLRLLPALGARVVVWAGMKRIADARRLFLLADKLSQSALEGFEVLPAHSLDAVIAHVPAARSPLNGRHDWHALIELVAPHGEAAPQHLAERLLEQAMQQEIIEDATIAASEAQAEALWLLRESISAAERAVGPAVQHDISVPVERMAGFVEAATPTIEAEFPGTKAIAFGHLGDGNVHFHVLAPPGSAQDWRQTQGAAITTRMHDLVTEWSGSISAEHGIGQMKIDEFARLADPTALAMLRAVKQALDPQSLLNPGKLVPLARNGSNP